MPGMNVVCLENFSNSNLPNGLHISQGDVIEVTNGQDTNGMLEGLLRGQKGLFPSHCVQEVRLRNPQSVKQAITTAPRITSQSSTQHFATAQRNKDSM